MASSSSAVLTEVEFTKPGQRHATPSPGSGDRVFYESLFKEKPNSEMALVWCIEHGVLPAEEAKRVYAQYLKIKAK